MITRSPILDKSTMYDLGRAGLLGNFLRTWYSVKEFKESDYKGDFTLRHRTIVGHPIRYYKQPYSAIDYCAEQAAKLGVDLEKDLIIQALECLLDSDLIIQGEVCRIITPDQGYKLCFLCSFMPEALRIAANHRSAKQYYGNEAVQVLKYYVPPEDYDDLMDLLDLYDEHRIEFSVYSKRLGIYNRRMIIWEIRNY